MNRRSFIKNTGVLVGTYSLRGESLLASADSKKIKVGLVGCGGRGTGAAFQAMEADPDVEITALADVFPDKLTKVNDLLKQKYGERVNIKKENLFIGFDSYKKLMATDVDVVLLAAPPNFRPDHLEEAVARGKHIFCEKPVAVDIPGIHRIQESVRLAKEKKLCIVSGFCFRYINANRELVGKIQQGAIGDVKQISTFRLGGELTYQPRQSEWSDLEYQLRNWFYYQRYAGDLVNEQSIHSIDYMSWLLEGRMPHKVSGTGGRQNRPWNERGNTFDHFALEFDYGDGVKGFHHARQQTGAESRNTVDIIGANGWSTVNMLASYEIKGQQMWRFEGVQSNMYQAQHDELFKAIRANEHLFDGDDMTASTLLAIWGREATYAGRSISYDEIMNSRKIYGPDSDGYNWDMDVDSAEVPKPGHYRFS